VVSKSELGDQAPPPRTIAGSNLSVQESYGIYSARNGLTKQAVRLQYAFGHGRQGMTYCTVLSETEMFEMRYSYFPELRRWFITPGHEGQPNEPRSLGNKMRGPSARACFACHTTTMPQNTLFVEPRFMGVGCESCHGPGSAHIAAARSTGVRDLRMAHLANMGGTKMNALCGSCHRSAEFVKAGPANQRLSQRFFTYGLSMSPCFQKSADKLSCSTCHNPHAAPSREAKYYEWRCLQCHSAN